MRSFLLLVALALVATAAVYSGLTTAPDVNTTLAFGFGGVAVLIATWLIEDRLP